MRCMPASMAARIEPEVRRRRCHRAGRGSARCRSAGRGRIAALAISIRTRSEMFERLMLSSVWGSVDLQRRTEAHGAVGPPHRFEHALLAVLAGRHLDRLAASRSLAAPSAITSHTSRSCSYMPKFESAMCSTGEPAGACGGDVLQLGAEAIASSPRRASCSSPRPRRRTCTGTDSRAWSGRAARDRGGRRTCRAARPGTATGTRRASRWRGSRRRARSAHRPRDSGRPGASDAASLQRRRRPARPPAVPPTAPGTGPRPPCRRRNRPADERRGTPAAPAGSVG